MSRRRTGSNERSSRGAPRHLRRRRTWPQRLALVAGALSTLALAASAAGLAYVFRKYEQLPRIELSGVLEERVAEGETGNYLIVGVDNASNLDLDDPVRIGRDDLSRSDTIMILRIEPEGRHASLLSLPRDLWVPIPDTTRSQRINTMIERGGPRLLVQAIDEYLGVPINHYLQVDFASFQGLVEAVDGVPVYFPHPARDKNSGLVVEEAGCVTLDPSQALAYVRSRYYEEHIDGRWVMDGRSDIGRIERQQDFIRRSLGRAVKRGARNPGTLDQLIDVGLDGITVDDELTGSEMFALGSHFRSFDPADLDTYSLPVTDDRVGGADILRLDEAEAEDILALFREPVGEEDVPPASVRLRVANGSGTSGQATEAARELAEVGFGLEGIGDAGTFGTERTVIEHGPNQRAAADLVARWLKGGAELEEVDEPGLVVITGANWRGVRSEPVAATSTTTTEPDDGQSDDGQADDGEATGGDTEGDITGDADATSEADASGANGTSDGVSSDTSSGGSSTTDADGQAETTSTVPPEKRAC